MERWRAESRHKPLLIRGARQVGKTQTIRECLAGSGERHLLAKVNEANPANPMNEALHDKLTGLVQKFICLGGMPEVVATYLETTDLHRCQQLLVDLIISIQADFATYRKKAPVSRLNGVFQSVVFQAGRKFMHSKACDQATHSQVREALQLLLTAGLVIPVTHSSANGIPLGAGANLRKQKMLLYDTGVFQRIMGLDLAEFLLSEKFVKRVSTLSFQPLTNNQ